jgi:hypothetical protein
MGAITLTQLHAAAVSHAEKMTAGRSRAEAAIGEQIAFAIEHKQPVSGSYWQAAHSARLRDQAAHALKSALVDVLTEINNEVK